MPSPLPKDRSPLLFRAPNWIGDAALSLPALACLHELRPGSPIVVATRRPALAVFDGHPAVQDHIEVPPSSRGDGDLRSRLKAGHFGAALLFSPSFRSVYQLWRASIPIRVGYADDMRRALLTHPVGKRRGRPAAHQARDYLDIIEAVGGRCSEPLPALQPSSAHRSAAREWLEHLPAGGRRTVAMAPFAAGGKTKCWPIDRYGELAVRLAGRGIHTCVIGGPAEGRPGARLVQGIREAAGPGAATLAAGDTTLPLMPFAALAEQLPCLVTNDTGPMHVWAAGGGRVVAVFGSSHPGLHGPLGPGHQVLHRAELPCAGCYRRRCPLGLECLLSISVGEVLAAVLRKVPADV